jgi:hypothetical protein
MAVQIDVGRIDRGMMSPFLDLSAERLNLGMKGRFALTQAYKLCQRAIDMTVGASGSPSRNPSFMGSKSRSKQGITRKYLLENWN